MTKAELARAVYSRHGGISNLEARRIVDLVFETIRNQLLSGTQVHIVGFGTLEIVSRKQRRGRNPITGQDLQLPARRALVFRPSRSIKSVGGTDFADEDDGAVNRELSL